MQHLLILLAVIACIAIIGRQAFKTLTLRGRGKLGACCAKGCSAGESAAKELGASKDQPQRVQFVPVEMLGKHLRKGD